MFMFIYNGYTHIHVSIRTGSSNINVTSIKTEITEKNNKRTQFPDRKRQTAEIAGVALLPSFVAIYQPASFFSQPAFLFLSDSHTKKTQTISSIFTFVVQFLKKL